MSYAISLFHNEISQTSGYALYAEARLGGNGDVNGMPELVVGGDGEDASYERICWDDDLTDGFDSGNIADALTAAFNGSTATTQADRAAGGVPVTFTQSSAGPIDHVELRAMTQAAASARWSDVNIVFYRGGVQMDQYSVVNGPSVDTIGATSDYTAESIFKIIPSGTDYDKVVISGTIRMTFNSPDVIPSGTDLALQAFVFTST